MDVVGFSIKKPVTIIVGIILVVLFGWIGLMRMPYQLSPNVIEPEISVTTTWSGATPYEVEREIIEEQEEKLKSIEGLSEMTSEARDGRGEVRLEFNIGTDVDAALLKVANRLQQVPKYQVRPTSRSSYRRVNDAPPWPTWRSAPCPAGSNPFPKN